MKAQYINRLATETSPYLLQHAHNPVDWFPWGKEALDKAKAEDKPILVSIGYSACHWCHVMERESFENEETAQLMNDNFINIKIDREERPDIDHIYMDAVQAMTGSGGWPLNVFLLPDGRPFFGGTYFPPQPAYNRSSWPQTLLAVKQAYAEKRNEIDSQAENLTEHIKATNQLVNNQPHQSSSSVESLELIAENILKQADRQWGGFGRAPKFPQTFTINYLLRHYHFTGDKQCLDQALLSLDKMIYGGIYDQLGGGFARYSTDEKWLAPHFEKMLYDNALLISTLSEAYQITQKPLYAKTIRQTVAWLQREMLSSEGGFLSAIDADSEGVEGKFYTWSKAEVDDLLGEDSNIYCQYYNITEQGNWEHTNILWITQLENPFGNGPLKNEDGQVETQIDFFDNIERCNHILLQHRNLRIRPGTDDKILLSWNALMVTALCKAYAALHDDLFMEMAEKNIRFLEDRFQHKENAKWFHTYKNGIAKVKCFLEDYAYLIQAYIHLQEITGQQQYLNQAKLLTQLTIKEFKDADETLFYFTGVDQNDIIIRKKEIYDGATPSGNSVMALNLLYLSKIFDEPAWQLMAERMVISLETMIVKYPTSFGIWANCLQWLHQTVYEIAIIGDDAQAILPDLLFQYLPCKVLQTSLNGKEEFPLLSNKTAASETMIYLCRNYSCLKPVNKVEQLINQINSEK